MRICFSLLSLAVLGLSAVFPAGAQDSQVLDFELEDQFGNVHRSSDVSGKIVVLIGADRVGSQFTQAWNQAIHDSLGDHPRYTHIADLAHANLRGVPFLLKGLIRSKFPQDPDGWVLMDWKGILPKTYEFAPKSANVLVFAPDGTLVHHAAGQAPDDEAVRELVGALRELLDEVTVPWSEESTRRDLSEPGGLADHTKAVGRKQFSASALPPGSAHYGRSRTNSEAEFCRLAGARHAGQQPTVLQSVPGKSWEDSLLR